jgi:hypothetical protein
MTNDEEKAGAVVQRQIDAYNARDIDAFMACYAEDVELLRFPPAGSAPDGCSLRSKRDFVDHTSRRCVKTYGRLFRDSPNLHAEIVAGVVHRNIVLDHEHVTGQARGEFTTVAIYEVDGNLIRRVWFLT